MPAASSHCRTAAAVLQMKLGARSTAHRAMPKTSAELWRMEVKTSQSCEISGTWRGGSSHGNMRVAAALMPMFGDISATHNDCCCTAAAEAPRTAREAPTSNTHKQQKDRKWYKFIHL